MHFDWSAIGSWLSFGATLAVGAFVYGKLTQQVADHSEDIRDLKADVRDVKSTTQRQETEIVRIKTHLKLHD